MSDDSPTQYEPYTLDHRLHRGRHTEVWVANGPCGRVALKVPRTEADQDLIEDERSVLESIDHPHIVKVLDSDPDGCWMALDFIAGQSFDQWGRTQSAADLAEVAGQVCSALSHLHEHGLVHADLKPRNILVDAKGHATVLDFGSVAKFGESRREFKGTMGFVAPELLKGGKASPRSDIYGLGAVLYAALTGRAPFQAPDPAALSYLPLVSLPAPPSAFNPNVPSQFERALLTLLQRTPSRRPGDLNRVAAAFRKAASSPVFPPVVGMMGERETLRRSVIAVNDNECRVVVVYGTTGSGRKTLINETLDAAQRARLRRVKTSDPALVRKAIGTQGPPVAAWLNESDEGAIALARAVNKKKHPCLLLLRARGPVPEIGSGSIQITPPPLDGEAIGHLLAYYEEDFDQVDTLLDATGGLPGALVARLDGMLTDATAPPMAMAILNHIRENGETTVASLAEHLSVSELGLLDHCEMLFAGGLLESTADGLSLQAT